MVDTRHLIYGPTLHGARCISHAQGPEAARKDSGAMRLFLTDPQGRN